MNKFLVARTALTNRKLGLPISLSATMREGPPLIGFRHYTTSLITRKKPFTADEICKLNNSTEGPLKRHGSAQWGGAFYTTTSATRPLQSKGVELYRLARLDKPIGTVLLFLPCTWPILMNASLFPIGSTVYHLALFGTGAVLLRGAGCIINDLWDRDIDKLVERTKNRPLAAGTLSPLEATAFLAGHLSLGLLVLLQLNIPTIILGVSSLALVITYPLMKRITGWPQAFLGLTFNYGVLMASCATSLSASVDWTTAVPLYIGGIAWTIVYDTIYALQDKNDDVRSGKVRSTAITFGNHLMPYLALFSLISVAGFASAGYFAGYGLGYHIPAVGGSLIMYASILSRLHRDMNNAKIHAKLFKRSGWIGVFVGFGIIIEHLAENYINCIMM